ncbi:MAG: DUF488 domain-containing protein [Pirellulales bacterium]|nr:DUF488 domain-containing protein [Pirellulales bacterium]
MIDKPRTIFTVGHSTHEMAEFVALLREHGVTKVVDVRSQPYGRLEHFRRENLDGELRDAGIGYLFLGRELGARREEPECYVDGQAVYERVAELPLFCEALDRLDIEADHNVLALLCAEREPLDCHRAVLVGRRLAERGWTVRHILADGRVENHADTERRMVDTVGVDPLFDQGMSHEALVRRAYEERGRQIAYRDQREELP